MLPTGIKGLGLLSRVEPPTGTKGGPFVRVGASNRDKRPLSPSLARLAVGPGTKAKGNRDKWPGTKACSVVVSHACHNVLSVLQKHYENADAHTMIEEFREMFENQARYERFNISMVLVCVQVD